MSVYFKLFLFGGILGLFLALTGCETLKDVIDNLPDQPLPDDPAPPIEPPADPPVGTAFKVEEIFKESNNWKLGTVEGDFFTTYRRPGSHESRLYLGGVRTAVIRGAETIADIVGDYAMTEHAGVKKLYDGTVQDWIPKSAGRWCCAGTVFQGRPVAAFNDRYNGTFSDSATVRDLETKERLFKFKPKGMPTGMVEHEGRLYAVITFGEECVADNTGRKAAGNFRSITVYRGGVVIGGGGGYTFKRPDGHLYLLDTARMTVDRVGTTPGGMVTDFVEWRGALWASFADPDGFGYAGPEGFVVVKQWDDISGNSTWDTRLTLDGSGRLIFGRTDKNLAAHVYRVTPEDE